MNYLITGGAGYLGSEIVRNLTSSGHIVFNIDLLKSKNLNSKNFNIDILDEKKVENIFINNKIDCIIHNLAKVPLTKNKAIFRKVNINSTKIMIKFFKKFSVNKLIFISSSAVYGIPTSCPITEDTERIPVEAYGESKLVSENLCLEEINRGANIIIIRPRTIIGLNRFGIFSILFDWIKNGLPIPVMSNGQNLYQFVDIRDLSEAINLASRSDYKGSLNIGSPDVKKIIDIIEFLKSEFDSKSRIKNLDNSLSLKFGFFLQKIGAIPLHDYHFKVYGKDVYFDISKTKKILKWEPKYTTLESFKDSYNHFIKEDDNVSNKSVHQTKIKSLILRYAPLFL